MPISVRMCVCVLCMIGWLHLIMRVEKGGGLGWREKGEIISAIHFISSKGLIIC